MEAQLNIEYGKALKDAGMERATNHANQVSNGWSDRAYQMLHHFLRSLARGGRQTFLAEDFRLFAYSQKLPVPPHEGAFGSVMSRAAKAGLITSNGTAKVKNPKAHQANA